MSFGSVVNYNIGALDLALRPTPKCICGTFCSMIFNEFFPPKNVFLNFFSIIALSIEFCWITLVTIWSLINKYNYNKPGPNASKEFVDSFLILLHNCRSFNLLFPLICSIGCTFFPLVTFKKIQLSVLSLCFPFCPCTSLHFLNQERNWKRERDVCHRDSNPGPPHPGSKKLTP